MLHTIKYISVLFFSITLTTVFAFTGVLDDVAFAIKTGNVNKLAEMFDDAVDVTILTKESSYSKSQAEVVVRDFFAKHSPKTFEFIHDGSSNQQSRYGIGKLVTSNGTFRTYVFVKQIGSKYVIQELRFEQE